MYRPRDDLFMNSVPAQQQRQKMYSTGTSKCTKEQKMYDQVRLAEKEKGSKVQPWMYV